METKIVLVLLLGVAACDIVTPHGKFSTDPVSAADRAWLRQRQVGRTREAFPPGFHFMYVSQTGRVVPDVKPNTGSWIQVIGSPGVAKDALKVACLEVSKMLRYAPVHIWNNIAKVDGTGLGLFTLQEKITVFPEYADLADTPQCRGRCDGECRHTCLFDGRKYETIAGVTGTRSVVLVDNVLCLPTDPYLHHDNGLVHEFAHSVEAFGLDDQEKQAVLDAYAHARKNSLWEMSSYAMANHAEYFAEATGAFFLVNLQSTTGGMTDCPGQQCQSQREVRWWLASTDLPLYKVLVSVYTDHKPTVDSGVRICERPT